jgi:hypothetical protein
MADFLTYYADLLVERYDLENVEEKTKAEIEKIWGEISQGLDVLQIGTVFLYK